MNPPQNPTAAELLAWRFRSGDGRSDEWLRLPTEKLAMHGAARRLGALVLAASIFSVRSEAKPLARDIDMRPDRVLAENLKHLNHETETACG